MPIDSSALVKMFNGIAEALEADKERLCALDGVIGDADHGIAMALGFAAARDALASLDVAATSPTQIFNTAAKSFLNAVGASSGPLYATAMMRAGAAMKEKSTLAAADIAGMIEAMARGIQDRGKAEIGEKTMVDAWAPAAAAAAEAKAAGKDATAILSAALSAARDGAEATKSMIAGKGRSSRLGERALGHIDPGAASAVTILEAMAKALTS
ncbi:dihydroxyacetone kinase subunit DhaL [Taklimakanibacter lacteus]|uniref:dihydroxyacetone kinase subunit DhaL n=1 Tax=Taklimakanibacter lacteus TaxID=2268456 RepID=UPI0013C44184